MKYESTISNSVFLRLRKTEKENRSLNSVFRNRRKTENENGNSNFVFKCRRKTVGTRVHAFKVILCCCETTFYCRAEFQSHLPDNYLADSFDT